MNVIQRSKLGLEEALWADLLKPQTSGIFSVQDMHGVVEECQTQTLIRFSDGSGSVRMSHGIAPNPDNKNEECYLIDNDFLTDKKTETDNASNVLNHLNRQSGRLFRWCIDERLHEAMGPSPVETAASNARAGATHFRMEARDRRNNVCGISACR